MKKQICLLVTAGLCLNPQFARAQFPPGPGAMSGPPSGPRLDGSMVRLFGGHSAFSGTMEMQTKDNPAGEAMIMPGKIAFASGKSRFEMDLSRITGGKLTPDAVEQMKALGMDNVIEISRPDKKLAYQVYPALQAYIESPLRDPEAAAAPDSFKIETTELGKETVDGHPCVKNKTVVTDDHGAKTESTVWNATDLKQFPIKIETPEAGGTVTLLFKDVNFAKPDDALFDPPADFKSYDGFMALMKREITKRMGGRGMPPPTR